jgi:hypothetical protein
MQHPETYIYAVSFLIFCAAAIFYGKQHLTAYLNSKEKSFSDFLSTSHYLQNISLSYIMHEKEKGADDIEAILTQIKQNAEKEIAAVEAESKIEVQNQIQKIKNECAYKMKVMNAHFVNETKTDIVTRLMTEVERRLTQRRA